MCGFAPSLFQVVDVSKRISDVPEWFKGSRLNYAENLLKHKDQDKVALYAASKSRQSQNDPNLVQHSVVRVTCVTITEHVPGQHMA